MDASTREGRTQVGWLGGNRGNYRQKTVWSAVERVSGVPCCLRRSATRWVVRGEMGRLAIDDERLGLNGIAPNAINVIDVMIISALRMVGREHCGGTWRDRFPRGPPRGLTQPGKGSTASPLVDRGGRWLPPSSFAPRIRGRFSLMSLPSASAWMVSMGGAFALFRVCRRTQPGLAAEILMRRTA